MKCDNCKVEPVYVIDTRGANIQFFCERHLPLFLRDKSRKPFLTRWSKDYVPPVHGLPGLQEEKKAVAKKTAKKKAKVKAVAEEPVEEVQAVVEDVTVAEEAVVEAVAVVEEVNESDRENSGEAGSSSTL